MNQVKLPFRLLGTGTYLPQKIFTAAEVDQKVGWPQGEALQKFKVNTRHFASEAETVSHMGSTALLNALSDAKLKVSDIDLIISGSASKEQPIPNASSLMQRNLGKAAYGIPCIDVDTTCLSFLSALHIASHFLLAKTYKRIAVVSAEIASIAINWNSPEVFTLFGDGAAAFIIESDPTGECGILNYKFETHSEGWQSCQVVAGASKLNVFRPPPSLNDYAFAMNGKAAFKLAADKMPKMLYNLFDEVGLKFKDIDMVVPHQASPLALAHMQSRLEIPDEKFVNHLAERGNQVAASIPIAFHVAKQQNRITKNQKILLAGTSAGVSLGAMILKI